MEIAHGFEIAIVAALSAAFVTVLLVRRGGRREQRSLKLLDQLPNLTIVLIDPALRVRSAYGEARTLDGEEIVGRRVEDMLPTTPQTAALIDNYRRKNKTSRDYPRKKRPPGASTNPQSFANSNPTRTIASLRTVNKGLAA